MSYTTIEGSIKYRDLKSFKLVVKTLEDRGYLNEDGNFTDSGSSVIKNSGLTTAVNLESLTIDIPFHTYLNLHRFLDAIVAGSAQHRIVWTNSDGGFEGGYMIDGDQKQFELDVWAAENGWNKEDVKKIMNSDNDDITCEFYNEVEMAFNEKYLTFSA